MITYTKASLRVGEVFFNEQDTPSSIDVLRYQCRLAPVEGAICEQRHTRLIQLDQPEAALWSGVNSNTRSGINRGQRANIDCQLLLSPTTADLDAFDAFWAQFAPLKNLGPINRVRLEGMMSSGSLVLAKAVSPTGTDTLVWHCLVRASGWIRLVHSASLYRACADKDFANTVAQANRLLHWHELKAMRESGHSVYDFGGWYAGEEDQVLLNINRFKEGFGGTVVPVYYADCATSMRGKIALGLKNLWSRN
jgi:hypothetical protein